MVQLIINAGSSSLKWALYQNEKKVIKGMFDRLGGECVLRIGSRTDTVNVSTHEQAVHFLISLIKANGLAKLEEVTQIVHRVVHGGEAYAKPTVITEKVIEDITKLSILAPLHNPANLSGILACQNNIPHAQQVAVFDTAFHHTIAPEVFLYGIPLELYEKHRIRKYGFHGTSHQFIAINLQEQYGQDTQIISCHLGSGSSVTAVRAGKSMDTTMGFTPLDGVLMSTRTGELDPQIPLFLLKHGEYSVEQLEELFNNKSGLLGLTGHRDLRDVYALAQQGDERCQLGIDMLSYRVAYYISALRIATPQLRAIAFTGGIGEGAWYVREKVCALLNISIDDVANKNHASEISSSASPIAVHIIPADEEQMMHLLGRSVEDN